MGDEDGGPKKAFEKFKWELERHFIVEEKATFVEIGANDESHRLSEVIVREHRVIWEMLEGIEGKLDAKTADIQVLKDKLVKHRNMEDRTPYPMLDRAFSEEKKRAVMNRIDNPI